MSPEFPKVPDPANGQAFNRYAYVLNNPLSFTDPTGHDTFCSCIDPGDGIYSSSSWITGGAGGGSSYSAPEGHVGDAFYSSGLFDNSYSTIAKFNNNDDTGAATQPADASGVGSVSGTNSATNTPQQSDTPSNSTTTTIQGDVALASAGSATQSSAQTVVQVGLGDINASDNQPAPAVEQTSVTAAKITDTTSVSTNTDMTGLQLAQNQIYTPPHDNGDCSMRGCDDTPKRPAGSPGMGVSGSYGTGPGATAGCDADKSCYVGGGAVLGASGKAHLEGSGSKDLLSFSLGKPAYGPVLKLEVTAGEDFGFSFEVYVNLRGLSGSVGFGPAEGLSGGITGGYRTKPQEGN